MNILTGCSFPNFNMSDFANEFIKDENGKQVFSTPDAKLVFCTEDCGYGMYLHTFYSKNTDSPNSRWHKRLDLSDEQLNGDCYVYLVGDVYNNPIEIIFEIGASLIVFTLTEEMKKALKEAKEYDFYDYYPNWC